MGVVRPFVKNDIPQIIELNVKLFPRSKDLPREYQEFIFEEACLRNPWFDERVRSLVYEESNGRVTGFLGVIPRSMCINGRPIQAAVCQHLMVERNALGSFQLFKTILAGPQDLTFSDRSADLARKIWERVGGVTSMLNSFYWSRPLRPCGFVLNLIAHRDNGRAAGTLARPISDALDGLINNTSFNPFRRERIETRSEELTVETFLAHLPRFTSGIALQPRYDVRSIGWLFGILEKERRFGTLRKRVVFNAAGDILGWYIYNLKAGDTSEVLQIAAGRETYLHVLDHLFEDAWQGHATALRGRLDPRFMNEMGQRRCVAIPAMNWMIVHSKVPEIIESIEAGNAFLSRLEGDLWFF